MDSIILAEGLGEQRGRCLCHESALFRCLRQRQFAGSKINRRLIGRSQRLFEIHSGATGKA